MEYESTFERSTAPAPINDLLKDYPEYLAGYSASIVIGNGKLTLIFRKDGKPDITHKIICRDPSGKKITDIAPDDSIIRSWDEITNPLACRRIYIRDGGIIPQQIISYGENDHAMIDVDMIRSGGRYIFPDSDGYFTIQHGQQIDEYYFRYHQNAMIRKDGKGEWGIYGISTMNNASRTLIVKDDKYLDLSDLIYNLIGDGKHMLEVVL